ncbi:hypothetical protein PHJA_000492700 [Phtheirospermum japonicum]|uniref:Uncharacterized protein n=1 Tax=Phtheirospermum japonicum TaxID=374723 RepID=A0A830BH42_9LAMI|nr:hypothetical protein PHJA_000492700 [Phtheirospermum japonicum]
MARIMEHPSLKLLLGEKEDVAMTRGAIIILLAYWVDGDNEDETLDDVLSNDGQDGSEEDESIIDNLIEHPYIENIACKVESGSGLGNILEELLKSVLCPRDSLDEDCNAHFKIVNMAWEDYQLISFDDVMGRGGSVGIKTARNSYSSDDMKVEPTSTSEGRAFMEPSSSYTLDALMPDPSLINQLLHDASFKDLAQQIQQDPRAVKCANFIFRCLSCHHDGRDIPSHELNQSPRPSLYNLFKKLSDGAQMLRLKERLDRIRGDNFWKTNGFKNDDFSLRMRVALSILIGYWSAGDVTRLVMPMLFYQLKNPSKAALLEDVSDVEIICYWADSNHDLEGLKNVLASKYAKGSSEFERRVVEIGHHQKLKVAEAVVRGYDNTEAQITVLLKGDSCILMFFSWFSKTCGMLSDACA